MINNILNKIFTDILWPKWLRFVSKSDGPKIWKQVFVKTALNTNTISSELALKLAAAPSVIRLMLNTFKADREFPSAKDFAISIAFELDQNDSHLIVDQKIDNWKIRNFASAVRRDWLNTINEDHVLKARLKDVRDKHPSEFFRYLAECGPDIEEIMEDKIQLKKIYFNTFNTPDATEKIVVWLPSSTGAVHFSPEDRITVEVCLNASLGADLGFFRMGHDYSLYSISGTADWLSIAYRDDKRALETMGFGSRSVGERRGYLLWVK